MSINVYYNKTVWEWHRFIQQKLEEPQQWVIATLNCKPTTLKSMTHAVNYCINILDQQAYGTKKGRLKNRLPKIRVSEGPPRSNWHTHLLLKADEKSLISNTEILGCLLYNLWQSQKIAGRYSDIKPYSQKYGDYDWVLYLAHKLSKQNIYQNNEIYELRIDP